MPAVTIAERKVRVGDESIPLLSGEMHYWRLAPENWRPILQRIKEMGLYVVATYACWDFHEIAPGEYDFTGATDPRRNLLGFLDLLTDEGFWIIFRPGPYIYSEWKNNGVPDYAAQYSRLDPQFWELAQGYMEAVTHATTPYLATNGGRIILWQADNEIDPWSHFYGEAMGLGSKPGAFQAFLRRRYADVAALNEAWRTHYTDFAQARAVSELFSEDAVLLSRYLDFRAFLHDYVNGTAKESVSAYRALGVDVPIILNTYSGVGTQRWADLEAIGDLAGPDIYPSREFLNRGGAGEHRHVLEAVRYARTYSKLPYIAEYEAGIWHDWLEDVGTLPPNHYRLICLSALQAGVAGWNWYMLVNRDNWYQAPINEWGRAHRDLFAAFQQITTLYQKLDPTTLEKLSETAVTFDPLQRATDRPGQALLGGLYSADIDYEFCDLDGAATDKPLMFYAGGAWLAAAGQQRLVDYVEGGGHLICVGAYPKLDEHQRPLNLLGIPEPDGIIGGNAGKIHLKLFDGSIETQWVYSYASTPGKAITGERLPMRHQPSEELRLQFDLPVGERYTIGYTQTRGAGRLTVLGAQPTPELLVMLHRQFETPILCRSKTGGVTSALFRRGAAFYLIATNTGTEGKTAEIEVAPELFSAGEWRIEDMLTGQTRTANIAADGRIYAALARKDGTILRLSPAAD